MDLVFLDSEAHIMISYHWGCQKTMLQVKTELESKGLRVWMDVDKMTGDTLETIARGVEKSSLVLIAMSRGYQSSPNCRSSSFISITEFKQRRRQQQHRDTNQLIYFLRKRRHSRLKKNCTYVRN